jgi:hypothetical protein
MRSAVAVGRCYVCNQSVDSPNSYYFRATSIALLCLVRVQPYCYCADMRL